MIQAMDQLEGTKKTKTFLLKVYKMGKTEYKTPSAIYRMYNNWKVTRVVPKHCPRSSIGTDHTRVAVIKG